MTVAADASPIRIIIEDDSKLGKKRINVYMDSNIVAAVQKYAKLHGDITQGEFMEQAAEIMFELMGELEKHNGAMPKPDFFERLMNDPRWRIGKR